MRTLPRPRLTQEQVSFSFVSDHGGVEKQRVPQRKGTVRDQGQRSLAEIAGHPHLPRQTIPEQELEPVLARRRPEHPDLRPLIVLLEFQHRPLRHSQRRLQHHIQSKDRSRSRNLGADRKRSIRRKRLRQFNPVENPHRKPMACNLITCLPHCRHKGIDKIANLPTVPPKPPAWSTPSGGFNRQSEHPDAVNPSHDYPSGLSHRSLTATDNRPPDDRKNSRAFRFQDLRAFRHQGFPKTFAATGFRGGVGVLSWQRFGGFGSFSCRHRTLSRGINPVAAKQGTAATAPPSLSFRITRLFRPKFACHRRLQNGHAEHPARCADTKPLVPSGSTHIG